MRRDVEFEGHGGVVLRGWLFAPEAATRPVAGIVMAHGLSAVKEMALDRYAEAFCGAGMAVLVYDHRNLGASDGEPRQEINPWAQARDYRRAIDWLAARPEVDAERIGIWGSSYSGGEVIVVGACDERVGAVVANVPFAGYPGADYSDTRSRMHEIRAALLDESGGGPADKPVSQLGPLPVVREPGGTAPAMLDQPESSEWFLSHGEVAPRWENAVTLVNMVETVPAWDPGMCIAHIAPRPLMMIVATEDRLAETAVSVAGFERAGEPKQLVLVQGHHFVNYAGEAFEESASAACGFFRKHLGETT